MKSAIPLDTVLGLLYGERARNDTGLRKQLARVLGKDVVDTLGDVRAITMALDRQTWPTPLVVRFMADDITFARINGLDCPVDRHDLAVSTPAAGQGRWEPHLVACFERLCRAGQTAYDIGANVGYHTLLLAKLVGPEGQCIAFEPNSENCRLVHVGCVRNGLDNVRLVPLALSDEPGWAYFSSHIGSNGGIVSEQYVGLHGHGTVVPVARLDDLSLPLPDFIKIDVEGAEYRALRGAERAIRDGRPAIISEFSLEMTPRVSGVSGEAYLEWIASLGYSIWLIDQSGRRPQPVSSIRAFLDGWGRLDRIEDLLFLPTEKAPLLADVASR